MLYSLSAHLILHTRPLKDGHLLIPRIPPLGRVTSEVCVGDEVGPGQPATEKPLAWIQRLLHSLEKSCSLDRLCSNIFHSQGGEDSS